MDSVKSEHSRIGTLRAYRVGTIALLMIALLMAGCFLDPDHDNPADPKNPVFENVGNLVVTVTDRDDNPLAGVEVRLLGYDLARFTLEDGKVQFELPRGKVSFVIELSGFVTQLHEVTITPFETIEKAYEMNGSPVIESIIATSFMKQTGTEDFIYGYDLTIETNDRDGSTDLTFLRVYEPGDFTTYTIASEPVIHIVKNVADSLGDFTSLINRDFRFVLYDESSDSVVTTAKLLNFTNYTYLTGDMLTSASVYTIGNMSFKWDNLAKRLLFAPPDTYLFQIFANTSIAEPFIDTLVTFKNPGDIDTMSVNIYQTEGFTDGVSAYWQLTMYDMFGNYVQSLRKAFQPTEISGE